MQVGAEGGDFALFMGDDFAEDVGFYPYPTFFFGKFGIYPGFFGRDHPIIYEICRRQYAHHCVEDIVALPHFFLDDLGQHHLFLFQSFDNFFPVIFPLSLFVASAQKPPPFERCRRVYFNRRNGRKNRGIPCQWNPKSPQKRKR